MKEDILKVMFALQNLREDAFETQDKRMWDFARECSQKLMDLLKEDDEYGVFRLEE